MDSWVYKRVFVRIYDNTKSLVEDFMHDLKEIFFAIFKYFPKHLYRFCIKVIQYMPILYKDEDWDYHFLLILIRYKLSRMRKCIKKNNILLHTDKYCNQMKQIEDLIELILEDDFTKEEDRTHELKWGKLQIESIPIPGQLASECRFLHLNVRTKKDEEEERKEHRKIMFLEMRRKKAAWNKLWSLLDKHCGNFWD
jgi:hypothetical protein